MPQIIFEQQERWLPLLEDMELEWTVRRPGGGRQGARGAQLAMILGLIFSTLGLGFAGTGAGMALWTRNFIARSVAVEGAVTELREVNDAQNHSTSYAPVFSFLAKDGQSYSITSQNSSNPPGFRVGQRVRVLYDPARPDGAHIDTFWQLWGIPAIFGTIGGFFTVFGIVMVVTARIQKRREAQMPGLQPQPMHSRTVSPDVTITTRSIDPM